MLTILGKYGIKATILADSISKVGVRFLTYEIEYPRIVLAELNTHKMLSKNSFSSRAVPFKKMVDQLNGRPVRFGANQAGMQDQGVDFEAMVEIPEHLYQALDVWLEDFSAGALTVDDLRELGDGKACVTGYGAYDFHKFLSVGIAGAMDDAKYHKQVFNRLTEAHQMMKTVLSGTELENFFWLRDHSAADPSLAELARVMNEARKASTPQLLKAGEWHLPYVDVNYVEGGPNGKVQTFWLDGEVLSLEDAIKISCARCAAVSYRNEGYGLEKSLEVYDRLVGDEKKHASAFEHCATPIADRVHHTDIEDVLTKVNCVEDPRSWEPGITHMDRDGKLWSGNLKGWIQYRKLIPGENYVGA